MGLYSDYCCMRMESSYYDLVTSYIVPLIPKTGPRPQLTDSEWIDHFEQWDDAQLEKRRLTAGFESLTPMGMLAGPLRSAVPPNNRMSSMAYVAKINDELKRRKDVQAARAEQAAAIEGTAALHETMKLSKSRLLDIIREETAAVAGTVPAWPGGPKPGKQPDSIYAGKGPRQSEFERRGRAGRQWIPGWSMLTDWWRATIDPEADDAEVVNLIVAAAAAEGVENLHPVLKVALGGLQSSAEYAGSDDPIQAAVKKFSREDIDTPAGPLPRGPGLNQRMLAKHWRNQREAATLAAAQEDWVKQKEEAYDAAQEASDLADDGDVPPEDSEALQETLKRWQKIIKS